MQGRLSKLIMKKYLPRPTDSVCISQILSISEFDQMLLNLKMMTRVLQLHFKCSLIKVYVFSCHIKTNFYSCQSGFRSLHGACYGGQ